MKATILAIGTELTQGQITNRNAAWLSQRLTEMNIEVVRHLTVADDRPEILKALKLSESDSHLILVTGGLGPTTDDFTRDVLSQWSGLEMKYNEESWNWIVERMGQLGIPVAESNRQQCYFPLGSHIYENPKGSARGFSFTKDKTHVFVFPGPPHELEAVWNHGAKKAIQSHIPTEQTIKLFKWGVIGRSEADLGEHVESILSGSGLQTGYRAHAPYVEVKVWCKADEVESKQKWLTELDQYLKPNTVVKDDEDLAEIFLGQFLSTTHHRIRILDGATNGLLTERLLHTLRKQSYRPLIPKIEIITGEHLTPDSESGTFAVYDVKPSGEWNLSVGQKSKLMKSPYSRPGLEERNRKYITEMSLYEWCGRG